jgi:hypothetical protein
MRAAGLSKESSLMFADAISHPASLADTFFAVMAIMQNDRWDARFDQERSKGAYGQTPQQRFVHMAGAA